MTFATAPTFLRDLTTGDVVPAELVYGIGVDHVMDWHNAWQPALGALKTALREQGVPMSEWPQTGHWNWAAKVAEDDLLGFRTFSVTAEGMTQALMRVDLTKSARLEGVSGKPLVYVDYLEVAPWNQSFPGTQKKYRGAGPILLTAAVELSFEEGFKGRLGLHSLPQAESYYEKEGMIDLGPDAQVQNLRYYEMTSDVAQTLLAQE
ncbi:MAG: GNAT family N-acetyltransferase [Pseudomonadota bacterium]